jgi:hypothetical protein
MSRKIKTILAVLMIFLVITVSGGIYAWGIQGGEIRERDSQLERLRESFSSVEVLQNQLKNVEERVSSVDSLLFSGRFTIPKNLSQSRFFDFIDSYSSDYSQQTFTNTEFLSRGIENEFNYYLYKVSGNGAFENVYGLVYAIEHSKELKKVEKAVINSTSSVDAKGIPHYLSRFEMEVKVYFASSDQYAAATYKENELGTSKMYDAFFPLIRNEIRPNVNNLTDVENAMLISIVPQGAFIADTKGNTILMKKGDQVYLGYLMDIDYDRETVTFVLNKGGIIEYKTLKMGQLDKKEGK